MSSEIGISEAAAIVRARVFVRRAGIDAIPVDIDKYLVAARADLRVSQNLLPEEAGNTIPIRGRHLITVNGHDTPERQRFTVLHEIAHIVLGLPSIHGNTLTAERLYSYVRRPAEEVSCDTFAAECLLPYEFLKRDLRRAELSFDFVECIATKYQASLTCTSSRAAINSATMCASILSQDRRVRFAALSASMREVGCWINHGIAVPAASVTGQCLADGKIARYGTTPTYHWTSSDALSSSEVCEETRVMPSWNQVLTLIWFDEPLTPQGHCRQDGRDEEEPLLQELDGNLSWPGRRKRR